MLAHLATRRLFGAGISTYATSSTRTSNGLWSSPSVTPASPRCLFHSPCRRPLLIRPRSSLLSVRHSVRFKSEVTAKVQRQPILRKIYNTFAYIGFFIISGGVVILGLFIYDATTYREEPSIQDCTVSELALSPRRGGPKNLPIAEHLLDDNDSEAKKAQQDKPRLVILGTGWGSTALLKTLNPGDYHVTVVSPVGYFLFTPMLPSATVGTLSLRTLVEPARRIVQRVNGHFLKGQAEDVDFENRLVEVSQEDANGNRRHFYLPYDKLVIAVGSLTNAHGVEGLEHCHFLKTIDDARMIKNKITQNMELACLPTTSDEERRRLLSFVICGGGPTGVEFAAELYDLLNEDLIQKFPRILRNEISVHVIQSRSHILNTYDEALSLYAENRFARDSVDVLTNSRVKKVLPDKIIFTQKEDGKLVTKEIPMGFCLWSTGVSQTPFARKLAQKLEAQRNKRALETDSHLRLIGAPRGEVYAIGDCATVQNNIAQHLVTFLRTIAWEKGKDPEKVQLTFREWRDVAERVKKRFPQASNHLRRLDRLFEQYDKDRSGTLDFAELHELLVQIDSKLTSLPATAQRANQQGEYLGRKFNKIARVARTDPIPAAATPADLDDSVFPAFKYRHLGSLAYVGNAAVFDLNGLSFGGGLLAVYLWRSIYFSESVSLRTRILLAMDWTKRAFFGRDVMSF
ncbi:hypothetical protein VTN31DRAFT_258 [Thermomyces dupontii]|uniref:uncharacterized protein n=1 Tax=Talaromyces thermophilus TaxID=28565 RepID=UPI003743781E